MLCVLTLSLCCVSVLYVLTLSLLCFSAVCINPKSAVFQCCAVAFIEKLNAESLSIRAEDFERYMSGAASPHDPSQVITTCDGLRLMQQNVAALVDLRARQERLMAEAMQLQQDMLDFCAATREQVAALLARTPLDIRPRRTKVNLDDDPETSEAERLPPPLQPQVVNHGTTPPSGTMCRSLSEFLSNLTETACTNSATSDITVTEPTVAGPHAMAGPATVAGPHAMAGPPTVEGSQMNSSTGDEMSASEVELSSRNEKSDGEVSEMPRVSVSGDAAADETVSVLHADESCVAGDRSELIAMTHADVAVTQAADDSASVSSLQLDSTLTSNADISLLDDPFIAIGAGCEKDSLLEEPDCTTEDSDKKTTPVTLSPDSCSGEKTESCEVADELAVHDVNCDGATDV